MSEPARDGFLIDCYVKPRINEEPMFEIHGRHLYAFLKGYAIIPKDEYDALVSSSAPSN